MRQLLTFVLAAGVLAAGAAASGAHPAYWSVRGASGSVFILSSVHALPKGIDWSNSDIDAAARHADTYVFETPEDDRALKDSTRFIVENGFLPEGETLTKRLSPAARKDYTTACAIAGMKPAVLENKRIWLAAIILTDSYLEKRGVTSINTPEDFYGAETGKTRRYLDTTVGQLQFLSRYDDVLGLDGFSAMLSDFANQPAREDALIAAWSAGDLRNLGGLIDQGFKSDPKGAAILNAHNREWAQQLEDFLKSGHDYFVVVGVAHLVGQAGVPSLLRADGYKVDGP